MRFIYQLIQLDHSLDKQVIVEGIEDAGMLEAVAILGADYSPRVCDCSSDASRAAGEMAG